MGELWKAFIARLVHWLTPKLPVPPPVPIVQAPEPPLKPGRCECQHNRCAHIHGKGKCHAGFPPKSERNGSEEWRYCVCQIFIPVDDDNDDEEEPETPSPSELERLWQK